MPKQMTICIDEHTRAGLEELQHLYHTTLRDIAQQTTAEEDNTRHHPHPSSAATTSPRNAVQFIKTAAVDNMHGIINRNWHATWTAMWKIVDIEHGSLDELKKHKIFPWAELQEHRNVLRARANQYERKLTDGDDGDRGGGGVCCRRTRRRRAKEDAQRRKRQ